jgi:hypothetical protein
MISFKKVSAILSSAVMIGATMGMAAAANFPVPFVSGGTADVAIVYGTGSGVSSLDLIQAGNIQTNLQSFMGTSGGSSSTVVGGDSVLIQKTSDHLNLNNTWSQVFTGTVTKDNLKTLLADGTYLASDNDEFNYEQKINLGSPELKEFRDSDYEALVGLSEKTPTVGFKINSNTYIMNYTLDFLQDVESDVENSRMQDIEGSDLPLMGRTYYVSRLDNGTSTAYFGQMILLDAANIGSVQEGETVTVSGHQVSIDYIDSTNVIFMVDGQRAPGSGKLQEGDSYKLNDGSYIGVRDISKLVVSGSTGSVSFSIGTGKLELPSIGADIKMNDDTITGIKGYVLKSTGDKLDKIVLEWKTDDESFLTPAEELTMPGFGALKFAMNNLVRNTEEKVTVQNDGDKAMELNMPFRDGDVSFDILYANASGDFEGIGKSTSERLATSNNSNLFFYERKNGNDWHSYFVATYNITQEGESYLLRAKVTQDASSARNETTIQKYSDGAWVDACTDKAAGDTCDIGDVSLNINFINYTSGGDEMVNISAGTNVNFHTAITPGGLTVYLPYDGNLTGLGYSEGIAQAGGNGTDLGYINYSAGADAGIAGHSFASFYLNMVGEDKDEDLGGGTAFSLTLDDNSEDDLQVSQLNLTGGNDAGTGSGGENIWYSSGLEKDETSTYENYVVDDCAPRVLHYTNPDQDYVEVYYPSGDSETYAEVYLADARATLEKGVSSGGSTTLGDVLVKDTEVSSVSSKNLIIVGGSCINSAAAKVLGFSGATCGAAFTDGTGVGTGEFLIKGVSGAYTTGKIALVVAGYEAADTVNAAKYLTTQSVDTSKEYKGTSSTSATLVTTTA